MNINRVEKVRIVRKIGEDRVVIRDEEEKFSKRIELGKLLKNEENEGLNGLKELLMGKEDNLKVEMIEIERKEVGKRVLIEEEGRNMEIEVEKGKNKKMIVMMRRMRKRIEF